MNAVTHRTALVALMVVVGLVFIGSPRAALGQAPGTPIGGAGFTLTFDEYGNALLDTGALITGVPVAGSGVLFPLPVPVVPGSVLVKGIPADTANFGYSDRIQFITDVASNTSSMLFQSFIDDADIQPADVSQFPIDSTIVVQEVGVEGDNSFTYLAAPATYVGISDGQIPEPATLALLGIGGLVALVRRHRV